MGLVLVTIDCLRLDDVAHIKLPEAEAFPCVSAAPITPVACATIHTGLNPPRHGVRNLTGYSLRPGVATLAELFKAAGYRTHAVVSCTPLEEHTGLQRGFDVYDSGRETGAWRRPFQDVLARCPDLEPERQFVWLHFFDLHPPFPTDGHSIKAVFDARHGMLGRIADEVEGLARRLPQHRFIVTGDHGQGFSKRARPTLWLGHGERLDGEDLIVPLMLCRFTPCWKPWAARHVDLLPTICREFGLPLPAGVDGVDIAAQTEELWAYSETYLRPVTSFPDQTSVRRGARSLVMGRNVFACRPTSRLPEMMRLLDELVGAPEEPPDAPPKETLERLKALGYV